jgi:hypothetical protein
MTELKTIIVDLLRDLIEQTEPFYLPVITDAELASIARNGVVAPYSMNEFTEYQRKIRGCTPTTKVVDVNYRRYDGWEGGWEVEVSHTYRPDATISVIGCGFHPEEAASDANAKLLILKERAELVPAGRIGGGWIYR